MRIRRLRKPMRNQRGIAILIALFAMTLMTFVTMEVSYDTSVDYIVASQQVNRIRAYYAAKSGVELSLLRIMLYKQAVVAFGDALGANKSMLDPIWSFPFMWPPTLMENMTEMDKGNISSVTKDSFMTAQYSATIQPEGGRIDINDLGSNIKTLKTAMIQQVVKIFKSELEHNEDFARKYRGYNFEQLVNNIADYIDEDKQSLNGGDESTPYRDFNEPGLEMPPNRALRTLDELHMVAGMTDDFYNVLAPKVTVVGTKGVNVNFANRETLLALDPTMTEEAVDKAIERRSDPKKGGPFQNDQDFFNFLNSYGVDVKAIQESKVPLLYDVEFNFRIISTGISGNVKREITAVTYDYPNLAARYGEMLTKQEQDEGLIPPPNPGGTGGSSDDKNKKDDKAKKIKAVKGRPTVVSWEEN